MTDFSCILVLNITKAGFQHKPRIFFLFCDPDIIDFFGDFGGIHEYFGIKNLIPWVVFMKLEKKKLILLWRPVVFMRHENQKIET